VRAAGIVVAIVGVAALAACGGGQPAPAPPVAGEAPPDPRSEEEGDELVRLALIADVTAVAPGQELLVAAHVQIAKGWHIHWINPGETGQATEVEIAAPPGFEVGAVRYPGPARFESPGQVTGYGHAGDLLLSAPVVAPDALPDEPLRFEVEVSWLACREVCRRGAARAMTALAAASVDVPSAPANEALFAAHAARLPRPWPELDGAEARWQPGDDHLELVLSVAGEVEVEFYPDPASELALVGQLAAPGAGVTTLRLLYRDDPAPARVGGVVRLVSEGQPRFFQLDLPWPVD
jgi:DsbC/DsbD-like thiol-disulfide interchange protein